MLVLVLKILGVILVIACLIKFYVAKNKKKDTQYWQNIVDELEKNREIDKKKITKIGDKDYIDLII